MTASTANLIHVDVDAGHLEVEVTGSGAPVVLAHGVPGSRRIWDEVVDPLVADRSQMPRVKAP
jgi:pimeloyl-ACP methyl ester carboxylesterase